ncbi:MAG: tRNA (adenosine(37)-N6)-threonylcarbamoyltransferase complex transferase subunit TsaD [Candidatus Lloydbacteria bacterium CG22_combo_CG10-13_8_21_14_all_47_15]|uniref:tRNA N6-adenosine threonylcarbamoyltransferase n=1 Tax=Candidatus Lloydbacteria bacterium CG22_combo_CG10-13_8_21_14_all_47_15 TaxID=1974635 RepID=A0A2H0CV26_9BACT|nr:MAG: tRNA (adenosine(37)-N6)-threonylcarbamoyltransferase complex transferase subunit TsaD [Candidatus Lloydbacteria bacterium CG22_combo_CG10-13_8_21_14_all_47_15]
MTAKSAHARILAIETSCDETAVAILEARGGQSRAEFLVRANLVLSQAALHAEYGGVFPSLAKREHAKNLVPLLMQALKDAGMYKTTGANLEILDAKNLETLFTREPELLSQFIREIPKLVKPPIDAIAVTYGPGLTPALWVGINFAKALADIWNVPIIPVSHMEGHIFSALIRGQTFSIADIRLQALALLVSGGHTELVLIRGQRVYEIIGQTRDDAVGEAFDKVGRMLGLPYPGGPTVAARADAYSPRETGELSLPRPMIDSPDFDFSFSGIKTAVLYFLKDREKNNLPLDEETKSIVCNAFQEAVVEVLVSKTIRAASMHAIQTILVGGGVSANRRLREALTNAIQKEIPDARLFLPEPAETGDNALMIAVAGFYRFLAEPHGTAPEKISAEGNLRLSV